MLTGLDDDSAPLDFGDNPVGPWKGFGADRSRERDDDLEFDDAVLVDADTAAPDEFAPRTAADGPNDESPASPPVDLIRIVTVCSHNRTRSVMSKAMLEAEFSRRLGPWRVDVRSYGFGPIGLPPIDEAVSAMRLRGLDVADHRSRAASVGRLDHADLIIAAEKAHVIRIAAMAPQLFSRTFTLPELAGRIAADPMRGGRSFAEWTTAMSSGRTAAQYLADDVPEVADPTGLATAPFEAATAVIEAMCIGVVDAITRSV